MNETTRPGRPELPEEKRRDAMYTFRVNDFERGLLDEVGTPSEWRNFAVNLAWLARLARGGVDAFGGPLTLDRIDLWSLYKLVFIEKEPIASAQDFIRQPELAEVADEP